MSSTWREKLKETSARMDEAFHDLKIAIEEGELDRIFDDGFGGSEGAPFTAWGPKYVYFPLTYDGSESVGVAPRNPCDIELRHQGGE